MIKKEIVITLVFLALFHKVLAQKIELRPSLGWGRGWGYKYHIASNDQSPPYRVSFDRPLNLNLQFPQVGIMLDYNYKNKLIVSVGRIHGKTELSSTIDGYSYVAALLQKWGGELLYSPWRYKSKVRLYIIGGLFYANNSNFDYNAGSFGMSTIDSSGNIVSKSSDTSINIRSRGTIVNAGIRFAFFNTKKHRERFSITLNLDIGLQDIWTYKNMVEYNYLSKYIYAYNTSKGNQIKIYFSKPITIYNLKKDKLKLLHYFAFL